MTVLEQLKLISDHVSASIDDFIILLLLNMESNIENLFNCT